MQKDIYRLERTEKLPLGAEYTKDGIRFSAVFDGNEECGVLLYKEGTEEPLKIPFPEWAVKGRVFSMEVCGLEGYDKYLLYSGDEIFMDPNMNSAVGYGSFGEDASTYSHIYNDDYIPKAKRPGYEFADSIIYVLHARGFTAHNSSKVRGKGTFKGIKNKLNYLRELGVTTLALMPIYEFDEIISGKEKKISRLNASQATMDDVIRMSKNVPDKSVPEHIRELGQFSTDKVVNSLVNFWGYTDGYYFCPKNSYAESDDSVKEFHELVEAAHSNGIEIILQFKFPNKYTSEQISTVLRFWDEKYNVDGFWLIGGNLPINDILADPFLYDTKILYDENIYVAGDEFNPRHANPDLGFMNDLRCFLKGDPNMAGTAAKRLRDADPKRNAINFLARHDTMRLFDIVSYNEKHNNDNGENGRDGADINFSWNCGVEGSTRRKNVNALRLKQIKNALAFTILSQGTPLIYSGDEFGNTQYGNNNPYNQDNLTSYIKWPNNSFSNEILDFCKELIKIRKNHPAFCSKQYLSGRDERSLGFPDVSLHGEQLWRPELGPSSHSFGILYYDKYFSKNDERLVFWAINMHWEEQKIAVPEITSMKWRKLLSSDETSRLLNSEFISLAPRSVFILETYPEEKDDKIH